MQGSKNTMGNYELLGQRARHGLDPRTSRVPVLRPGPLTHWWTIIEWKQINEPKRHLIFWFQLCVCVCQGDYESVFPEMVKILKIRNIIRFVN